MDQQDRRHAFSGWLEVDEKNIGSSPSLYVRSLLISATFPKWPANSGSINAFDLGLPKNSGLPIFCWLKNSSFHQSCWGFFQRVTSIFLVGRAPLSTWEVGEISKNFKHRVLKWGKTPVIWEAPRPNNKKERWHPWHLLFCFDLPNEKRYIFETHWQGKDEFSSHKGIQKGPPLRSMGTLTQRIHCFDIAQEEAWAQFGKRNGIMYIGHCLEMEIVDKVEVWNDDVWFISLF